MVVSGEAGVGKTRFCAEVAEKAARSGVCVATARCWLDDGAPPLWPWQSILAELGGDRAADLLTPDTSVSEVGPDRFARFVAVTDLLAEACARTPVCLVIDDVHGADAGALLLTRFVARSLSRLPLLVVLSQRNDEPADGTPEARLLDEIEREATSIVLSGFDLAETRTFLAQYGLASLDAEVVATLFGVTGGHPLFLRRIAQTMGNPGAEPAVPSGLQVAIQQALGRLTPTSRRVLSVAAVLGPTPMVTETAVAAGCDAVSVLDAVEQGTGAGLVASSDEGRFAFSHDLVRSAIENSLGTADRLEAHARAATVAATDDLAVPAADRLARAAHHARNAATRSSDDARRAISICQDAARAMVRNFAYEQADALLSAAIGLHSSARLGHPSARLTVEWAQAASLRGHMNAARIRYGTAVARAESEGDLTLLAEAALGFSGVWLDEHHTPVEKARVHALQRKALAGLPPDGPDSEALRCRLVTRLAAEAVFDGGPTEPLWAAVDAARSSGDPRALAEALSLSHHALFVPEHTGTRLELADELVRLTSQTDQGVLSLMGLLWRTIDLVHLGDKECTRALEVLRERATALGNQHILYNVAVMDVLFLINKGRLGDAEAEALRCHQQGEQIGKVDSPAYLAAHLATIRWMQGRDAEMLDHVEEIATSPALGDTEFSFRALAACLAARAGEPDRARNALDRFLPDKLADLAPSGTWMAGLVAIVEAAATLGDEGLASQAYDLLTPYALLPTIGGLAIVCLGSTERPLGLAAATLSTRPGRRTLRTGRRHQPAVGSPPDARRGPRRPGQRASPAEPRVYRRPCPGRRAPHPSHRRRQRHGPHRPGRCLAGRARAAFAATRARAPSCSPDDGQRSRRPCPSSPTTTSGHAPQCARRSSAPSTPSPTPIPRLPTHSATPSAPAPPAPTPPTLTTLSPGRPATLDHRISGCRRSPGWRRLPRSSGPLRPCRPLPCPRGLRRPRRCRANRGRRPRW